MGNSGSSSKPEVSFARDDVIDGSTPPKPKKREALEDKLWRKFSNEPLVPIGCGVTAYFLVSGLKSFRDRDPFKSQRMMRNRVAAQFATLLAFVGYIGLENADFRLGPMTQDKEKLESLLAEAEAEKAARSSAMALNEKNNGQT
mmetsp:Transcript_13846/g.18074  ORF Transcript_13846/g.18074 Transcript_13846/m.18074 type:complete len:144 (+) Transcript_13846:131-562(+)